MVTPAFTSDAALVPQIAELVNRVCAEAEKGLWASGSRTSEAEVADLVRAGEIAVVTSGARVVGAVRVHRLEDGLGEFGMLVAAPQDRGTGIGRDLVAFAENWTREQGLPRMQLELLVPQGWEHPVR
ncbi:GNAT family N-acetyltransferase [Lentzea sp. NPDC060358]|uniref:GNAT family N-acetyltransferase n=1 Tax=Lentzea sp. NPDC060358 TaxID=3347103 RepID=UPI003663FDC7